MKKGREKNEPVEIKIYCFRCFPDWKTKGIMNDVLKFTIVVTTSFFLTVAASQTRPASQPTSQQKDKRSQRKNIKNNNRMFFSFLLLLFKFSFLFCWYFILFLFIQFTSGRIIKSFFTTFLGLRHTPSFSHSLEVTHSLNILPV